MLLLISITGRVGNLLNRGVLMAVCKCYMHGLYLNMNFEWPERLISPCNKKSGTKEKRKKKRLVFIIYM